jgi:hypothetical protein
MTYLHSIATELAGSKSKEKFLEKSEYLNVPDLIEEKINYDIEPLRSNTATASIRLFTSRFFMENLM